MVETKGTYTHGRHMKKIWLKSLCLMSNIKVFVMQAGRTNTTNYIDSYVTHMDQRVIDVKIHRKNGKNTEPVMKSSVTDPQ